MLIDGKMQDGSSLRKVLRELNICKTSVRNIWNTFRDTGSVVEVADLQNVQKGIQDYCLDMPKRNQF